MNMDMDLFAKESMQSTLSLAARHPGIADELVDDQFLFLAVRSFEARFKENQDKGKRGWWDDESCSIKQLKQMLGENLAGGDMLNVMILAAMIYVRECAEG